MILFFIVIVILCMLYYLKNQYYDYKYIEYSCKFSKSKKYNDTRKLYAFDSTKKIDVETIKKVITFDVFEGKNIPEGKKSVAINVTLQAFDKTLTEKDLDQISQKIIETVKEKTGATIRS